MPYLTSKDLKSFRLSNQPKTCPILMRGTSDWVVDHCHTSGLVRGVISRTANGLLGKIENCLKKRCQVPEKSMPGVLRACADYLEKEHSNYLHPVGLTQLEKRFRNNLTSSEQVTVLTSEGATPEEIERCSNSLQRSKLFRKLTKNKYEQ